MLLLVNIFWTAFNILIHNRSKAINIWNTCRDIIFQNNLLFQYFQKAKNSCTTSLVQLLFSYCSLCPIVSHLSRPVYSFKQTRLLTQHQCLFGVRGVRVKSMSGTGDRTKHQVHCNLQLNCNEMYKRTLLSDQNAVVFPPHSEPRLRIHHWWCTAKICS